MVTYPFERRTPSICRDFQTLPWCDPQVILDDFGELKLNAPSQAQVLGLHAKQLFQL